MCDILVKPMHQVDPYVLAPGKFLLPAPTSQRMEKHGLEREGTHALLFSLDHPDKDGPPLISSLILPVKLAGTRKSRQTGLETSDLSMSGAQFGVDFLLLRERKIKEEEETGKSKVKRKNYEHGKDIYHANSDIYIYTHRVLLFIHHSINRLWGKSIRLNWGISRKPPSLTIRDPTWILDCCVASKFQS